ncbi:hypothetical protein [Rhodonellum sp.]|uniref:hypothetical protein n=1 Tax=Rhodonellum sp. TaxID=2231180 RepID=UPI00272755B5|nr:hypothetical protein [Rhodonellum sp.]MDO9554529.1 hypothetical protein [Rhodonellum sp.]
MNIRRDWVTGLGIVVIVLASSCGSVRRLKASKSDHQKETAKSSERKTISELKSFTFGDTLAGMVPLPFKLNRPFVIPVESAGIKLELTLTDSTISYTAVAKPVARSTLSYREDVKETETHKERVTEETTSEVIKKRALIPWWFWILIALILAGWILLKTTKLKIPFL